MHSWQTLLVDGNHHFNNQQWLKAEHYYLAAEKQLNTAWQVQQDSVELLMAWVCAAHNLAAVYEQQSDNQVALQYLIYPHQRMLELSKCEDEKLSLMGIKALSITYAPILAYRKKHKLCNDCYSALTDANLLKLRQQKLSAKMH